MAEEVAGNVACGDGGGVREVERGGSRGHGEGDERTGDAGSGPQASTLAHPTPSSSSPPAAPPLLQAMSSSPSPPPAPPLPSLLANLTCADDLD